MTTGAGPDGPSTRRLWPNQRGGYEGEELGFTAAALPAAGAVKSSFVIDFAGWTWAWVLCTYTAHAAAAGGRAAFRPIVRTKTQAFPETCCGANGLELLEVLGLPASVGAVVRYAWRYDARGGATLWSLDVREAGDIANPGSLEVRLMLGTE